MKRCSNVLLMTYSHYFDAKQAGNAAVRCDLGWCLRPSNHTVQLTSVIYVKSFAVLILNVISQGIGCTRCIEINTNRSVI